MNSRVSVCLKKCFQVLKFYNFYFFRGKYSALQARMSQNLQIIKNSNICSFYLDENVYNFFLWFNGKDKVQSQDTFFGVILLLMVQKRQHGEQVGSNQ